MTTYNTGNPIGSTDARDLYDNAQNLDNFANGSAASYTDRLGVSRRSLSGIDAAADNVLNAIGYSVPVAYASGISLTLTSQTVDYNGVVYAPKSSALPFTTSSWGVDSAKFRAVQVTDADLITYTPAGTGAVATTVQSKLQETVSVLDFGADPTGVADSTAAFNAATMATVAHTGNDDLAMRREICVPPGDYKILGTVYVRKGQMLRGAGDGATRITTTTTSTGRVIFKLGFGLISGVETQDPGGLPPVIEKLHIFGGDTSGGTVDMRVAGAQARDLFITSAGVGVRLGGGDTILSNCIIDQGLNAINLDGQNHIIDSCLFYNINYGISVLDNTFDVQINNCHFEYGIYDDILFANSATQIQNVSIQNCQFVKNAQYATSDQAIHIRSNGSDILVHGCEFRNQRGYSIRIPTGIGNNLRVSNCVFDGNRTNPAYTQSTTAAGVFVQNGNVEISNCRFENLYGNPIAVNSTLDYPTTIKGCSYRNISTAASFVTITATTGALTITDCVGDDVLPLINLQSNIRPRLKNNVRWLGAAGNSGGRFFWRIPVTGSGIVRVGVVANPAPGGNLVYRKASAVFAARQIGWNGSALTDYAYKSTTYETPIDAFVTPLDVQVDLDSVGGGATAAYSAQGRYLVVSVPNTYYYTEIEADFTV